MPINKLRPLRFSGSHKWEISLIYLGDIIYFYSSTTSPKTLVEITYDDSANLMILIFAKTYHERIKKDVSKT